MSIDRLSTLNHRRLSDGLFVKCARQVAEKYPEIQFEEMYLDTVCLKVRVAIYSHDDKIHIDSQRFDRIHLYYVDGSRSNTIRLSRHA
jgi:hypothetical protein